MLRALVERTGVDPGEIDDVLWGCVGQVGPQASNIGRTTVLSAGWPEHVPAMTIDRQCGSAQQAVHFAAQGVMSGTQDLVIAGGVQNMSAYPILCAFGAAEPFGKWTDPWTGNKGWEARYGTEEISQFRGAEMMATKWDISREDNDAFGYQSHQRALAAQQAGYFDREITPLNGISADEGPRADTSLEKLAELNTLVPGGTITAGASSQISDGSAALLIASEDAVKRFGFTPRARIHHLSVLGDSPVMLLSAPIPATQAALKRTGMSIDDIDAVEINEAFAAQVLGCLAAWESDEYCKRHFGLDKAFGRLDRGKLNVDGGAIAIGHPVGASGARIVLHLLNVLRRNQAKRGIATICIGGGLGGAMLVESL